MSDLQNSKSDNTRKKLSTRSIAMIIMAVILVVAIIAVAVALIVVSEFNVSRKEEGGFVYSLSRGQATVLEYTGEEINVVIPAEIGGRPVVAIAEKAFYKNNEINSITIESTADNFTIGAQAFSDMELLVSVVLPDGVKTIPTRAFSGCDSLTEVVMGNGVETIEEYAFSECPALANIYISVSSGGKGKDDSNYNTSYNMTMPSSLKTIGDFAFYQSITASSVNTRKILFNADLAQIGQSAFDGCNKISFIDYAEGANSSLTEIGNNAFYGCTSLRFANNTTGGVKGEFFLTKALSDRALESIGDGAFEGCTYSSSASSRAVLNIYEDTEYIGDNAFRNVKNIKTLNFYASNPDLGEGAFYGAANLSSVNYYTENGTNEDGSVKYAKSDESSLSPEVTSIPSLLFYGTGLKGFKLGKTVTSIGDGAFSALTNVDAIEIVGVDPDELGNTVGEHFAIYKLAPYYEEENQYYTVRKDHYLLMSADMTVIYSYIGAFSDSASPVKDQPVSYSNSGQFTFLQNLDINITTIRGYAFAETKFSYISLPEKLTAFGANVFNGKSLSGDDMFIINFEGKTESYYSGLLTDEKLSKDFLGGIDAESENILVRLSGSQSTEILNQYNSYFNAAGLYTASN